MSTVTKPHEQTKTRYRYIWGIDLAQSLDYCGIVIGKIANESKTIRYAQIRKFNKVMYPEVISLCTGELTRRWPPTRICVDYTSEKAFSESLEAVYHPSFLIPNSKYYRKWRMVLPYTFSQQSKLELKQISKQLHTDGHVKYPKSFELESPHRELFDELQDQMKRETASPGQEGRLSFKKPEGFHNDLAIANELMLFAAKQYLGMSVPAEDIVGVASGREDKPYSPRDELVRRWHARLDKITNNGQDGNYHDEIS